LSTRGPRASSKSPNMFTKAKKSRIQILEEEREGKRRRWQAGTPNSSNGKT